MSGDTARNRQTAIAFGKALRVARRDRGMSQDDLGGRADLDRTYPSLLERGRRQPTLAMLLRIADALGSDPTQLVRDTMAFLRGVPPIKRHLYRLAYRDARGAYCQSGKPVESLELAANSARSQNVVRKDFALPPLTHVVLYEESGAIEIETRMR